MPDHITQNKVIPPAPYIINTVWKWMGAKKPGQSDLQAVVDPRYPASCKRYWSKQQDLPNSRAYRQATYSICRCSMQRYVSWVVGMEQNMISILLTSLNLPFCKWRQQTSRDIENVCSGTANTKLLRNRVPPRFKSSVQQDSLSYEVPILVLFLILKILPVSGSHHMMGKWQLSNFTFIPKQIISWAAYTT